MVPSAARLDIQPEVKTSACLLAVEIGEFGLKLDERVVGAGDVAGAAGADAMAGRGGLIASITSGWRPMQR